MEELQVRRANFEKLGQSYPPVATVITTAAKIAGVNGFWLTPEKAIENRVLIWLHGGAYAAGSIRSHGSLVSHYAAALKLKILFVDYSLAPEHPYPAALNEVVAVYTDLTESFPGCRFDLIGDSAGAGLILSLLEAIQNRPAVVFPGSVVLLSPWVSLTAHFASMEENRGKDVFEKEYIVDSGRDYLGGTTVEKADPEQVEFKRFPPVLLQAGGDEVLRDDSTFFYGKIRALQPRAILSIYAGQKHVWPLANIHSDASKKALEETVRFLM